MAAWRERHTGAHERATVLEELERRLEGLSLGVREVLVGARENTSGPYRHIRGVVADLLHVHMETAPLIEAALGDVAQYVVATQSHELIAHFTEQSAQPTGRVGVVRLDVLPALTGGEQVDLTGQAGVIGRADRFVETAPEFAVLAKRLLGKTWIVETLADAVHWAAATAADLQFVTRACELVAPDGTLLLGPRQSATGLISRRAELRALRGQLADLAAKIERGQAEVAALEEQIAGGDQRAGRLESEHRALSGRTGQSTTGSRRRRRAQRPIGTASRRTRHGTWPPRPASIGPHRPRWPWPDRGWRKPKRRSERSKPGCEPTWPVPPNSNNCATGRAGKPARRGSNWPGANNNSTICKPNETNWNATSKSVPGRWPTPKPTWSWPPREPATPTATSWRPNRPWPNCSCARKC